MSKVYTFAVNTNCRTNMIEITREVTQMVQNSKVTEGICIVYVPHTTAAVTINENADPDVVRDFLMEINKIVPFEDDYKHMEGNSAAHIKASMMGFSETIIVDGGKLVLGTWQGIYLMEFDGARTRKVHVKIIEG